MQQPTPGRGGHRLGHRTYEADGGAEVNVNDSSDYLFVLPMTRGRLWLRREDETIHDGPVRPGMVRIVRPGERSTMAAQADFESLVLWVPATVVRGAADGLGAQVPEPGSSASLVQAPRPEVHQLGKTMVAALTATDARRDMLVEGLSAALLALVLEPRPPTTATAQVTALDDDRWGVAVEFADASLSSRLDVDTWAAAVGMPTHDFARRFRARTGQSPYAWFLDRRVDRAGRLLLRSHDSLADIALATGFNSQSHFTDVFRRRTGIPPGRWRAEFGRS